MTIIDLADPKERAKAIAHGYIWSGPAGAQKAACEDIVSGRVPMPDYELPPEARDYISQLRDRDDGATAEDSTSTREARARESIHKMFAKECEPERDALLAASAISSGLGMVGPIQHAANRISMATAATPGRFVEECRALTLARYARNWVSLIQMFGLQEDVEREMTEYLLTFVPRLHRHLTSPLSFSPVPGNDDVFAWGAALGVLGEIWVKGHQQGIATADLMATLWQVA